MKHVRPDYNQQLAYWDTTGGQRSPYHPTCRLFSQQRWNYVGRFLNLDDVQTMLDVGCGLGMASALMRETGKYITGLDFSLQQLTNNSVSGISRLLASSDRLPFADQSFDLVTCWELLHHVPLPEESVAEMARVTRSALVIFEPNLRNPAQAAFSAIVPEERGSFALHSYRISNALRQAGLKLLVQSEVGWVLPNRMPFVMARLLARLPFQVPLLAISRCWVAVRG